MRPYYEDEYVKLYLGDCREVLPSIDNIGVILADPQYGVGFDRASAPRRHKVASRVFGDDRPFDPSHLLATDAPMVLWGANAYADKLPASVGWLVWDKYHPEGSQHSQAELAWTNFVKGIRIHREAYHGFMRQRDGWFHPTQKPVGLFRWILALPWTPDDGIVVDPYMGSGPAVIAAKNLGRRAIGIEIEERYCEIAARRLSQGVLDLGDPEAR